MTPEAKVKKKIKEYLDTLPLYYFTPIGSVYGKSGVPDVIICYDGRFIGIEVKAPGRLNTQTALQKKSQLSIEAAGGVYLLVDDVKMVRSYFAIRGW